MKIRPDSLDDGDFPVPFGRYTLLGLLGEGGMARVFKAELQGPEGFRKKAAVKIIHASVAARSEKLRRALINEARVGGLLHHPNVVETYEFGEIDGLPYIAMEYVRGVGLDDLLRLHAPLPPSLAVEIALQIAAGLDHAHALEDDDGEPIHLVHRDLKPSNVILSRDGLVKVMDFGIAKASTNTYNTTETGMTKGTPAYMSPEQAEGLPLDGRSDLFALGAIFYELLTGTRLFQGETMVSVLMAVLRVEGLLGEAERWQALDATAPGAAALICRCLRKDREARFDDVLAFETGLKELARSLPTPPPLKRLIRESMKELRGGEDPSSASVPIEVAAEFSGPSAPMAAADVGATRAQTPSARLAAQGGVALNEPVSSAPSRTMPLSAPLPSSAEVPAAPPAGTLWPAPGPPSEARSRPWKPIALAVALILLGAAGMYAAIGGGGSGTTETREGDPTAALSEPIAGFTEEATPVVAKPRAKPRKPSVRAAGPTPEPPTPAAEQPVDAVLDPFDAPEEPTTPAVAVVPEVPKEVPEATPRRRSLKERREALERRRKERLESQSPPPADRTDGPKWDPRDTVLRVEAATPTVQRNEDGSFTVRYRAELRGARGSDVKVWFNPPKASWLEAQLRSRDDVRWGVDIRLDEKRAGKTYWYIEAKRKDGEVARWGSRDQPIKLRVK